jgi:adenylate kinase family enzyme
MSEIGQKVVIIGTSGSGKTTLAKQLAAKLGVPHVEIDALHWEKNWTSPPGEILRERVSRALSGDRWVVDGNYTLVRDIMWGQCDTIIWLDYSFPLTLWRVTKRTVRRVFGRKELWNGNRETFKKSFLSKESIILWVVTTHKRRRREFPVLLAKPEYAAKIKLRFNSPKATAKWLDKITRS